MCYIIDRRFHIIAMGLTTTRRWAQVTRVETLVIIKIMPILSASFWSPSTTVVTTDTLLL